MNDIPAVVSWPGIYIRELNSKRHCRIFLSVFILILIGTSKKLFITTMLFAQVGPKKLQIPITSCYHLSLNYPDFANLLSYSSQILLTSL